MASDFGSVRAYLESERSRLTQELRLLGSHGIEERANNSLGKRDEAAIHGFELEKQLAYAKRAAEQLAEVERALKRLEKGTYGICDCCGKPIPPARLEALPQANSCLECKVSTVSLQREGHSSRS